MVKEISAPNGAEMDILQTMCVKEVWGAELQEKDAMLIREKVALMEAVGERENVPVMVMGKITDTGRMVVKDNKTGETAVDLDLELVLGELPKKTFVDHHVPAVLKPLVLPEQLTVMQALDRVLRLLSVGSKRFLWLLWLLTIRLLAVGFYDSRVVFYHFSRSVEEYRDVLGVSKQIGVFGVFPFVSIDIETGEFRLSQDGNHFLFGHSPLHVSLSFSRY